MCGKSLSSCETSSSSNLYCYALFFRFSESVILNFDLSNLFFRIYFSLAEYSDENMMDASNLASCLAPTLLPIPEDKDQVQYLTHTIELIRTIITHYEEIFPSDGHGPIYEKFAITVPM